MKIMKRLLAALLALALLSGTALAAAGEWRHNRTGWWYRYADGTYPVGEWLSVDGARYHFDGEGYMQTGWLKDDGTWYYLKPSGAMAVGWKYVDGAWYYLDADGAMQTGWLYYDDAWYYLKPSGAMAVGWRYVDGSWYYLDTDGVMLTGWLYYNDAWYYLKPSGAMAVGWRRVDGDWYYFGAGGAMQTGWLYDGEDWYYLDRATGIMATGVRALGGMIYTFGSSGGLVSEAEDWRLILVNGSHLIPEDYEVTLLYLSNGKAVDERIYPALQQMFDDARAEGVDPTVVEGYRSHEDQVAMMALYVNRYLSQGYSRETAERLARGYVAEPGTSEHELGIAVDIGARGYSSAWEVYAWLAENAWRYGFILRYPDGKEYITGIEYEPWHYRYVGVEAAWDIYAAGLTLEEYLG